MRATRHRFAAALGALALAGCMPYVTRYVHVDAPNGQYVYGRCGATEPPRTVRYEAQGIQVDVRLEAIHRTELPAHLSLRAPKDVAIVMPDPVAKLRLEGEREAMMIELEPWWTTRGADGRLVAGEEAKGLSLYRFGFKGLPPVLQAGSLEIPPLLANGVAIPAQRLRFETRVHAVIAPFNC